MTALQKMQVYMAGGVREYRLVNPANLAIYVYRFADGEIANYRVLKMSEATESEVLDKLEMPLRHVLTGKG